MQKRMGLEDSSTSVGCWLNKRGKNKTSGTGIYWILLHLQWWGDKSQGKKQYMCFFTRKIRSIDSPTRSLLWQRHWLHHSPPTESDSFITDVFGETGSLTPTAYSKKIQFWWISSDKNIHYNTAVQIQITWHLSWNQINWAICMRFITYQTLYFFYPSIHLYISFVYLYNRRRLIWEWDFCHFVKLAQWQ